MTTLTASEVQAAALSLLHEAKSYEQVWCQSGSHHRPRSVCVRVGAKKRWLCDVCRARMTKARAV